MIAQLCKHMQNAEEETKAFEVKHPLPSEKTKCEKESQQLGE